jgi:hypothetical protein
MSLQVVNPATGEIAMQFADTDLVTAKIVCEAVAEDTNQRWDVVQINVVFVCGKGEIRNGGDQK